MDKSRTGAWAGLSDIAGILRYVALITQAAAGAPAAAVLLNQLSAAIVWTRTGAGQYLGTLAGAFPANKVLARGGVLPGGAGTVAIARASANTVTLETRAPDGTLTDGLITAFPVEISVYP